MRRAHWMRRNGLALAAVVVLLPAILWITFADQWFGYFDGWPSRPVEVAAGQSVQYGNSGYQVETTDRYSADSTRGQDRGLPAGTDLVVVTVSVDPGKPLADGTFELCTARLEESSGANHARTWGNAAGGAVPLDGTSPLHTSCSSEMATPYTFDAEFVVPADAGQGTTLSLGIAVVDELPDYARFALD